MEMNDRTLQMMSEVMGLVGMAKNLRNAPPEVFERLRNFVRESGVSFATALEGHRLDADEIERLPEEQQAHVAAHKNLATTYVLDVIYAMEASALVFRDMWEMQQISNNAVCDRFAEKGELQ